MLEQLMCLEGRLNNELHKIQQTGMGYLRGTEGTASNFSSFVKKSEKLLRRLKKTGNNMRKCFEGEAKQIQIAEDNSRIFR